MSRRRCATALPVLMLLSVVAVVAGQLANEAGREPPAYPERPDAAFGPLEVVRVVDGDTIVVRASDDRDVTVRLLAIDTPETVHPTKPVEAFGKEASAFTTNLLKGERVWLAHDPAQARQDRYGRALAYVWRHPDGLFVNLEIVRQGYGHADDRPGQHLELFRWYQNDARQAGRGLWADRPQEIEQVQPAATTPPRAPPAAPAARVAEDSTPQQQESVTVYATRTGTKYHRSGCRHLARSQIPMTLEAAKARYGPCSVCRPPS